MPQLIFFIISVALQIMLAPRPPKPKPATLSDFDIPTSDEDRPVPVVFGKVTITGANVVAYGDLASIPIVKKGGKK
ncbi:MAG: hypothetical protein DRJ61_05195 [Acidobacteria bacterium]|nr:MAG: hypothetical protein DRJ61_05195 [Acidobacteriota bacterium]